MLLNYKGIYFADEEDKKYTCPVTGAHFEFIDMCRRLKHVQTRRKEFEVVLEEISQDTMHSAAKLVKKADTLEEEKPPIDKSTERLRSSGVQASRKVH